MFCRNSVDVRKVEQPLSEFETVKDVIQNIPPSELSHVNLPKQASEKIIVGSQTNPVSNQIVAPSHSAPVGLSTASSNQVSDTRSMTPLAKSRPSSFDVSTASLTSRTRRVLKKPKWMDDFVTP